MSEEIKKELSEEIKKELSDFEQIYKERSMALEQIYKERSMALERSMAQIFGGSINDIKADELGDSLLTSAAASAMLVEETENHLNGGQTERAVSNKNKTEKASTDAELIIDLEPDRAPDLLDITQTDEKFGLYEDELTVSSEHADTIKEIGSLETAPEESVEGCGKFDAKKRVNSGKCKHERGTVFSIPRVSRTFNSKIENIFTTEANKTFYGMSDDDLNKLDKKIANMSPKVSDTTGASNIVTNIKNLTTIKAALTAELSRVNDNLKINRIKHAIEEMESNAEVCSSQSTLSAIRDILNNEE